MAAVVWLNPAPTPFDDAEGRWGYRAADGSVTNDWSKTQAYADAIQRNAKDQDRLAELTRGAALIEGQRMNHEEEAGTTPLEIGRLLSTGADQ